eukprot:scaffold7234_cov335-Prasinococcus_capsulatus_cf.AAC.3
MASLRLAAARSTRASKGRGHGPAFDRKHTGPCGSTWDVPWRIWETVPRLTAHEARGAGACHWNLYWCLYRPDRCRDVWNMLGIGYQSEMCWSGRVARPTVLKITGIEAAAASFVVRVSFSDCLSRVHRSLVHVGPPSRCPNMHPGAAGTVSTPAPVQG